MTTVLFTVALMALVMAIMSIGIAMGRPELKGSCGGIGSANCMCESTPGDACLVEVGAESGEAGREG